MRRNSVTITLMNCFISAISMYDVGQLHLKLDCHLWWWSLLPFFDDDDDDDSSSIIIIVVVVL